MISRMSTRVRFALASMLLILPLLVAAVIVVDQSFRRSQDQIVINQYATADVVAQSISDSILNQQDALAVLAETEAVRAIDQETATAAALMDDYRVSRPSISGLFLLRNDLTVAAQSGGITI
jgi:hypothetical protein